MRHVLKADRRRVAYFFFLIALVASLVLTGCGRPVNVRGDSMAPTIKDGDASLVDTEAYRTQPPVRGDIILFQRPGENLLRVSRVVGLPDEQVEIRGGAVYINGVKLEEPYAAGETAAQASQFPVPPESFFVLNDNRSRTQDSRTFGAVPFEAIQGRWGAPRVTLTVNLPYPDKSFFEKIDRFVALTNLVLALLLVALLYSGATIFNATIRENYGIIQAWYRRPAGRLETLRRRIMPARGEPGAAPRNPRAMEALLSVSLLAVLYSFLEPGFGPDWNGLMLFISMGVTVAVVTAGYEGVQVLFSRRRYRLPCGIKLFPAAALIAVGFVLLSRAVEFHPGLIYGFVGAYAAFSAARKLGKREVASLVVVGTLALLSISTLAFFLRRDGLPAPVNETLAAVSIGGLEGLIFALIPLTFNDGEKLAAWSRPVWGGLFVLVAFSFFQLVLNQEGRLDEVAGNVQVGLLFVLTLTFTLVSGLTWAFFRWRGGKVRETAS